MKNILTQLPFYLPLFGILTGFFLQSNPQFLSVAIVCCLLLLLYLKIQQFQSNWKFIFYVIFIFAFFGFVRQNQVVTFLNQDLETAISSRQVQILVTQDLGERKSWNRYECELKLALVKNKIQSFHSCFIDLYVKNSNEMVEGRFYNLNDFHLNPLSEPVLPGDFNFKQLKHSRKFIGVVFTNPNQFKIIRYKIDYIIGIKAYIKSKLNKVFVDGLSVSNLALVMQLIWGDKTQIDDDLKLAFQQSGTTHVLSVSGMHIALLFAFISFLLEIITLKKYKSNFVKICIIPLLWGYAFLTGFSAPVIRAVAFFSYYLLGSVIMGRPLKLLHVLMVVGIIQLLINPLVFQDIGFQLSYLAVLGLSTVLPFIKRYYEDRKTWQKLILDALAISVSSTITTYPLILYYFHQFAIWFLMGNLILLPMFTFLMYWLFVMVFLTAFSIPLHWVVVMLNGYLNAISWVMKISLKLPHPYIYSYGFNEILVFIHLVFIHIVFSLFYSKIWWRYGFVFAFLFANFWVQFFNSRLNTDEIFKTTLQIQKQTVKIEKSNRHLNIYYSDTISQQRCLERFENFIHRFSIDSVTFIRTHHGLKNQKLAKL